MSTKEGSPASGKSSPWLSVSIMAAMSLVLFTLAAGSFIEDGSFVYRTWLLAAGGTCSTAMALAVRFRK